MESPSDLSGLKIAAGGAIKGEILQNFAAAPISTQIAELYQALDRGVVDGSISYYTGLPPFRLHEVVDFYTDVPLGGSFMMVFMSKARFDSLPEAAQAAIDKHSGAAFSEAFGELWDAQNQVGRSMATDAGGEIIEPSADNIEAWTVGMQPVIDSWMSSVSGGDVLVEAFIAARDAAAQQ